MYSQLRPTATESSLGPQSRSGSSDTQHPPSPSVVDGQSCPNCETHVKVVDTTEAVCPDCHIVVTPEPVSTSPQPRYGERSTDSRSRSGGRVTLLYADRGLGVGIDENATTDRHGTSLSITQRRVVRERGWKKHLSSQAYRLDYALSEIRRLGGELGIPTSDLEQAARLFRQAHAEGYVAGRSVDGFASACLLAAIRQSRVRLPISQREIQSVTRATTEQVRTARGVLEVHLEVKIPPMDPRDFLPRAISHLSAPWRIERCAVKLLNALKANGDDFKGISPRTLAAAAVHAAYDVVDCDGRPSLDQLSDLFDVAASTISERKSRLLQYSEVEE